MRESDTVEFKSEFINDLNKEIIAFANTKGGDIYIGINDDGTVCGVENIEETELKCTGHIRDTVKPDVSMFVKYEQLKLSEKDVLKITVNKGAMSPYYIAGKGIRPEGVYVRMGTACVPATETAIVSMIKDTSGEAFEEMRSLNQNLTFIQAEAEFENAGLSFGEAQKRSLGLIGKDGCYTNLALLLSDQCEHKIKFAVFSGKQKEIFKDRHEFSGSLFRQVEDLVKAIDDNNRLSSPRIEGLRRTDVREYPEAAVREAVLNAVIHREYALGGYTLASVFDDRIEIISLGGLVRGVEMNDIMMGVSYLRNTRLAEVFYRLHWIEAYGTGIAKIKKEYDSSKKKPTFEASSNAFKVVLPKLENENNSQTEKYENIQKEDEAVLKLIRENQFIVRKDVEALLGVSPATATRILSKMVNEEKISRTGTGKTVNYTL